MQSGASIRWSIFVALSALVPEFSGNPLASLLSAPKNDAPYFGTERFYERKVKRENGERR